MTTPVEHVTAATSAIRYATAVVGRTLPEIETEEEWSECLDLVEKARLGLQMMEFRLEDRFSG